MNKMVRSIVMLVMAIQAAATTVIGCSHKNSLSTSAVNQSNNDYSTVSYDSEEDLKLAIKRNPMENIKSDKLNFIIDSKAVITSIGMQYYKENEYLERKKINFGSGDLYSDLKGITCFRGNNMRDSASFGAADVKEERLEILWKKNIGRIDEWSGVGWNGQPAIVQWEKDKILTMNIKAEKKNKEKLKEVIYAALDGNVYFLDLEDGKETRDKLNIGAPVKGSLTVDPRGIPLLYVGQGINKNGEKFVDFAYRIFSLTNFSKLYEIKGRDNFAKRTWSAFDSTLLVDKNTDSIFLCGENGLFYTGNLNTRYENNKVQINPELTKYRYDVPGKSKKGIENSIAIYEHYGYFADNDGILQCINIDTLEPLWALNVNDDTDSTIVLEKDNQGLNLYTACEVDHQGNDGYSYVRKIDATSGKILWQNKYKCTYHTTNGGVLATPILGKGDIENLVIFNIARTPKSNGGMLIAFDKNSGQEVWSIELKNYCWSSPVAIYTNQSKSYIVQCDSAGKAILIEGKSGKILDTLELGSNVEGSPAVFDDTLVVGTRGCQIVGLKIK